MAINKFPPVQSADESGLLAIGGDLEIPSLLLAYNSGIFPWPISRQYPLAWFSPNPRGILFCDNLHISNSLKKFMKKNPYTVTFNQAFERVILACATVKNRKGQKGTWITDEIIHAYIHLHLHGNAYSVEVWDGDELVGGLYGVWINQFVCGESMFYRKKNASKVALVILIQHLQANGINWLDTQMVTPVVESLGGIELPRIKFLKLLKESLGKKPIDDLWG